MKAISASRRAFVIGSLAASPVPPVPEVTAELEALPAQGDTPAEPAAEHTMPEIEHPIGPLRQAVLDALADADEPLTVARIIAELPAGTTRGSGESAIRRELVAGRIDRGIGLQASDFQPLNRRANEPPESAAQ